MLDSRNFCRDPDDLFPDHHRESLRLFRFQLSPPTRHLARSCPDPCLDSDIDKFVNFLFNSLHNIKIKLLYLLIFT